ncbi:MAG: hypothetical protein R3B36_08435 [Polyangiaceae bacterium]
MRPSRVAARLVGLALAGLLLACGGAGAPSSRGGVVFAGGAADASFDPDEPRLVKARAQVTELLGHELELSVDAALVPKWRGSMASAILGALEAAAQDLAEMKRREPEAFAFAKKLARIECVYTALAPARRTWHRDAIDAELRGDTLHVRVRSGSGELVPRGLVRAHLVDAWEKQTSERLAGLAPGDVAAADQVAWVRQVTREADGDPRDAAAIENAPMAEALTKVLALDARATGAGREETQKWLTTTASRWFARVHTNKPDLVRAASASSGFRRAEDAWSKWALAHQSSLPDEDRLHVLEALFVRVHDRGPGAPRHPASVFPHVDRFGLALQIVDEWRAQKHPGASRDTAASRSHEHIVCPRPLEGTSRPRSPHCNHDIYDMARDDANVARRLAEAMVSRHDPILAEQVFANFEGAPTAFVLSMWRAIEQDPVSWKAAGRVFIEELSTTADKPMLVAEARRLWRERPDRRGEALYLLVHVDRYGNGAYEWDGFEQDFGQKVGRAELDAYLAQGPLAVLHLPTLWPALADMPRGPSILKPLELAWAGPTLHALAQQPYGATRSIIGKLCGERAVDEVRAVQGVVARFAASRGEHAGPASRLASELDASTCAKHKPSASRPPRGRVIEPFGKRRRVRIGPKPPADPKAPSPRKPRSL